MFTTELSNLELEHHLKPLVSKEFRLIFDTDLHLIKSQEELFHDEYFCVLVIQNGNGSNHFTLLISRDDGEVEFFDSLALKEHNDLLKAYKRKNKWLKKLVVNTRQLQETTAVSCGAWIISRCLALKTELKDYLKLWKKNQKDNEKRLYNLYSIFDIAGRY